MTTRPTVEPAGVSEATVWIVSKRGKEALGWALESGGKVGPNDCLMVDAADYDALRQQLAELREELAILDRIVQERDAFKQQLAEMRELLQEAYAHGTIWRGDRIYKYVADTSRPSRGKHEQRVIGHANGRQEYLNECVCGKSWPDCAQPERQGADTDRALTLWHKYALPDRSGYAIGFTQFKHLVEELTKPSPPPTDDIVAGLRQMRSQSNMMPYDVEKLDRAIAALGEKGWQPIETAPKDGTDVLVTYKNCDSWFVHNAFWMDGEGVEPDDIGWWSYTLTEVSRTQLDGCCAPTHWRPRIAPPVAGGL